MHRDDFQFLTLGLLIAIFAAVFVVGDILLREITRRPRVVGIVRGGASQGEGDVLETETG